MAEKGYVYVLASDHCESVKIGGSIYPPAKRLKEVNQSEPYKSLGPWQLVDFREVLDWRKVEYFLHYAFRELQDRDIVGQRELFRVSLKRVREALYQIDDEVVVAKPKIERLFNDVDFLHYLSRLFVLSGLTNWLSYQGAWTLCLYPSTEGGRYFTINIGSHEVAFTTLGRRDKSMEHFVVMDKLIMDFPEVLEWVEKHQGFIVNSHYRSALMRAVSVRFEGDFNDAQAFLNLTGVRRALLAYWHDGLFTMQARNSFSVYAKSHNYNAVAELAQFVRDQGY
ncbi:GIY-YIG nuclease family protein [Cardiobacteriaceae bacterium TAE3-ERU3]|nr:GIY-YIG nuclease family protein [Cardiobacteriaceae bacterium TAE3-ERU3]